MQATTCLARPKWDFVQLVVLVLVILQLFGLGYSVERDRIELRFIEAVVAGRKKDEKRALERLALARKKAARLQAKARRLTVRGGGETIEKLRRSSLRPSDGNDLGSSHSSGSSARTSSRMSRFSCFGGKRDARGASSSDAPLDHAALASTVQAGFDREILPKRLGDAVKGANRLTRSAPPGLVAQPLSPLEESERSWSTKAEPANTSAAAIEAGAAARPQRRSFFGMLSGTQVQQAALARSEAGAQVDVAGTEVVGGCGGDREQRHEQWSLRLDRSGWFWRRGSKWMDASSGPPADASRASTVLKSEPGLTEASARAPIPAGMPPAVRMWKRAIDAQVAVNRMSLSEAVVRRKSEREAVVAAGEKDEEDNDDDLNPDVEAPPPARPPPVTTDDSEEAVEAAGLFASGAVTAEEVFQRLDVDGSGELEKMEIRLALLKLDLDPDSKVSLLAPSISPARPLSRLSLKLHCTLISIYFMRGVQVVLRLVQRYDRDGSGTFDLAEFVRFVRDIREQEAHARARLRQRVEAAGFTADPKTGRCARLRPHAPRTAFNASRLSPPPQNQAGPQPEHEAQPAQEPWQPRLAWWQPPERGPPNRHAPLVRAGSGCGRPRGKRARRAHRAERAAAKAVARGALVQAGRAARADVGRDARRPRGAQGAREDELWPGRARLGRYALALPHRCRGHCREIDRARAAAGSRVALVSR